MHGEFLWRLRVEVTLVGGLVWGCHIVEDEDPCVNINIDIDPAVRNEHLTQSFIS